MAWDKTLPTGNTKVNQSDNAIRDNWAWLEDSIKTEHTDPATIPSSPSSSVHLEGSSRVWVYTGATLLDSAADIETALAVHSARFTAATAANTGMVVIDQNTTSDEGSLWVCTDGLTGAWKEITQKHAAMILASTLSVGGLLTASAGMTIPTAQALDIPNESNVLTSSTDADQMNPFALASRLLQGGADPLKNLPVAIEDTGDIVATSPITSYKNLSARSNNTRALVIAWGKAESIGSAAQNTMTLTLEKRTGVSTFSTVASAFYSSHQDGLINNSPVSTTCFAYVTDLPAETDRGFRLSVGVSQMDSQRGRIAWIDLGDTP